MKRKYLPGLGIQSIVSWFDGNANRKLTVSSSVRFWRSTSLWMSVVTWTAVLLVRRFAAKERSRAVGLLLATSLFWRVSHRVSGHFGIHKCLLCDGWMTWMMRSSVGDKGELSHRHSTSACGQAIGAASAFRLQYGVFLSCIPIFTAS
jgi:hypothetical protein